MRVREQYFTDGVIIETELGIIIELTDGRFKTCQLFSYGRLWYLMNPNHMILYGIEALQDELRGGSR